MSRQEKTKLTSSDVQMDSSKMLYYYRQIAHLMLKNAKNYDKIKEDIRWINILDKVFDDHIKKNSFPEIFGKNVKNWQELKKKFYSETCFKKVGKRSQSPDSSMTSSDYQLDDDSESSSGGSEKYYPPMRRNLRPRRLCTIQKTTKQPQPPSKKKLKTTPAPEIIETDKEKTEESVKCDPFKYIPRLAEQASKSRVERISTDIISKPAPVPAGSLVRPITPAFKIVGNPIQMPIQRILTQLPTPTTSQPSVTQPSYIVSQSQGNNNIGSQILFPLAKNITINAPTKPVKGKVLLINSVPCLVQNGDQIQLPMIPSNTTNTNKMPNTTMNNTTPESSIFSKAQDSKSSDQKKVIIRPEVIKIEDDSDSDDFIREFKKNDNSSKKSTNNSSQLSTKDKNSSSSAKKNSSSSAKKNSSSSAKKNSSTEKHKKTCQQDESRNNLIQNKNYQLPSNKMDDKLVAITNRLDVPTAVQKHKIDSSSFFIKIIDNSTKSNAKPKGTGDDENNQLYLIIRDTKNKSPESSWKVISNRENT